MINLLTRILGDTKQWRAMEHRAEALPGDRWRESLDGDVPRKLAG